MLFTDLEEAPPDPIFGVTVACNADPRPDKVNLGVGVYRTADLKPGLLKVVQEVEVAMAAAGLSRSYMPIDGNRKYTELLAELLLGDAIGSIGGLGRAQTVGATSALRVVGEFLARLTPHKVIYLPNPSWANHRAIFQAAGLEVRHYDYYDRSTCGLAYGALLTSLGELPPGSPVLFHACCHNPTGVSPTFEQWEAILQVVLERRLVPLFDTAYQGFGDGLDEDAAAVRAFAKAGLDMFVTYSCSKNFGLYGERVGMLLVMAQTERETACVLSQLKKLIRSMYSNPPFHGQKIVEIVLSSKKHRAQWLQELAMMRERLQEMRKGLMAALSARSTGRDFGFLGRQQGLFSFIGLERDQVHRLQNDYGIYTPPSGRINVAGLNSANIDYVADAIASVL